MEWIILSISGISSLLTGYSIKKIPSSSFLKKYFISFLVITSLWLFSNFFLNYFNNYFWFKASYAFGAMITSSALILVISFTSQKKLSNIHYLFLNIIGILFFSLCFIDKLFFFKNNYPLNTIKYRPLFTLYSTFLSIALLYLFYKLIFCIKKSKGYYKYQALYIFLGLSTFGLFTLIVSFILPSIGYIKFAKFDVFGSLFFISFTSYAIIRYHIMEIKIKINKRKIYAFMVAFTTIIYIIIIMLILEKFFSYFFKYNTVTSQIFACSIIALTFIPVHTKIKSLVNYIITTSIKVSVNNKLKKMYSGTIKSFIKAIEEKDQFTQGHSYRVVNIALKIGMEYGLSSEDIEFLKYTSVLHDIGNIAIPDNILIKPDKLTKKEFDEIKKHPVYGKDIISSIKYFEDAGRIISHHHEYWDGRGYPDKIKGEQIPLLSRIIFIAEVFDALTSERSYRLAFDLEAAVKEIQKESGKKFDPGLVECFMSVCNNF